MIIPMKNTIILLLTMAFALSVQATRSKEQTERLNAKNGFRKYILGAAFGNFSTKVEKQLEDSKVHSKLYKFKNEDLNITNTIKAEWIIFQFTVDKLDEISFKLSTGSKEFF